jgi:hypothetical protein
MQTKFLLVCALSCNACAGLEQYVAFDAASASSTYSAGNLVGSPAFTAQQALSGGSGYWCSAGGHGKAQTVTWTGVLNSRRTALGLKIDWAYSPGEVKILTSSDGANFEEARCWQPSTRAEVAYVESVMFDAPLNVKAVTISMRVPMSWGYFGINSVALLAEPGPYMLVSGITSAVGEQCLTNAGSLGVVPEPCLEAIAAGDGREVMKFDADGQIVSMKDGLCMTLVDGDTTSGGSIQMEECSSSVESSDGRSVFATTPTGQMKMPRLGNYCLTMSGDGAARIDIASSADVSATSSSAQHMASSIVDGSSETHWASGFDPTSAVDVVLDFGAAKTIETVTIDWEQPPLAFEIQVASGGTWKSILSTVGNNLNTTKYFGPAVTGHVLRIRMSQPHPTLGKFEGHAVYAIKKVQVLATSAKMIVQDCVEASENIDARDKFFMVAVPEFDPSAARQAKNSAALLAAATSHLGSLLADLYVAMPTLASCGFVSSMAAKSRKRSSLLSNSHALLKVKAADDASVAVAAISKKLGVDEQGLAALLSDARSALDAIPR